MSHTPQQNFVWWAALMFFTFFGVPLLIFVPVFGWYFIYFGVRRFYDLRAFARYPRRNR